MRTLAAWSARLTDALAIAFFVAMFACVLAQVVFRYFLGSPLTWSDELARYLFVWCAFLGWVIAARRRSHHAVTIGRDRMSPRAQAALKLVGALAVLGAWFLSLFAGPAIYAAMGLAGFAFLALAGVAGIVIPQKVAMAANSFPLLAAPLFILMGNLMDAAEISYRIFDFAKATTARPPPPSRRLRRRSARSSRRRCQ